MKTKTNFKKMYLIDDFLYNTINQKALSSNVIPRRHSDNKLTSTIQFNQIQPSNPPPHTNNKMDITRYPLDKENAESKMNYYENDANYDMKKSNQDKQNEFENKSLSNHLLKGNVFDRNKEDIETPETMSEKTKMVDPPSSSELKNTDHKPCLECNEKHLSLSSKIDNHPLTDISESDNTQMEVDDNSYKRDKTDENQINKHPTILHTNSKEDENQLGHFPYEFSPSTTNETKSLSNYPSKNRIRTNSKKRKNRKTSSKIMFKEPMKIGFEKSDNSKYNLPLPLEYTTNNQPKITYQQPKKLQFNQTDNQPSLQPHYNPLQYLPYQELPKLNSGVQYEKPFGIENDNQARVNTQPDNQPSLQLPYNSLQYLPYQEPSKLNLGVEYKKPLELKNDNLTRAITLKPNRTPATVINSKKREIEYDEEYPLIPQNIKVTYTCTICNLNFKKKSTLLRHNKNIHDSFYQLDKGDKRKLEEVHFEPNKKMKKTYNLKRKSIQTLSNLPKKTRTLDYYVS